MLLALAVGFQVTNEKIPETNASVISTPSKDLRVNSGRNLSQFPRIRSG